MDVQVKRVYEVPEPEDGVRVLVDRLWPRGVSKEEAELDRWIKEIAPSNDLREWFGHDSDRWAQFKERYRVELSEKEEPMKQLKEYARDRTLTLVYAAKDEEHNNAVVLRDYLLEQKR